jgi:hypothetical protein
MAKINIDEIKGLADPIEITLDGKTVRIDKITQEQLDKTLKIEDSPVKQLEILVFGEENGEFEKTDMRKVAKALDFIMKEIKQGVETKNVIGEES